MRRFVGLLSVLLLVSAQAVSAAESVKLAIGLSIIQCKGLDSGEPSCVETSEPVQDISLTLALDEEFNVLVGTHAVNQKVRDLNISGIVSVYHLLDGAGVPLARYFYDVEVMTWADNAPETLTQVKASMEVPTPDQLAKFTVEGDVYEKDAYAAQPLLFIGPYGSRP